MSTLQSNIFGEDLPVSSDTAEVARILEKYPALTENRGMLYFFLLKESCPFIIQLPENRVNEIKAFCNRIENYRRRSQDFKSSIPQ